MASSEDMVSMDYVACANRAVEGAAVSEARREALQADSGNDGGTQHEPHLRHGVAVKAMVKRARSSAHLILERKILNA
jgi:hypothetical protein